ncbi:hypothetical protein GUITHDRAFT_115661 [Guillardia theta CCMP2712]|uniref:RWP-RK domain-containing protein n=1 Tax=Guillardia theta (strain CCMP2712) TaxID=905079 RepID=L1IPT1_GUITC|nr:hypothetical protein GUITHDRAFT_115661 [Guillardia theta CCMP2712]EKX38107.1 hypothetical protein GUITHDRAFT_115661 [Guillardia theta CCMP2712]|eukprot:XP_005825087.1 hypothetical protein GUITHDRAFT_115661 [Guillardia theta CCMP2712]
MAILILSDTDSSSSSPSFPSSPSSPTILQRIAVQARPRHSNKRETVQLSRLLLSQLFHLRQQEAAHHLGISLTSLKTACRRLGLDRWPYTRDRSSSSSSSSSSDDAGEAQTSVDRAALDQASEAQEPEPASSPASGDQARPGETMMEALFGGGEISLDVGDVGTEEEDWLSSVWD